MTNFIKFVGVLLLFILPAKPTTGTITDYHRILQNLPAGLTIPFTGLNQTCNNKLCSMFESALTCKAIGINLKKICAKYILGFILGCPQYPQDFFNAPYVCVQELSSIASLLTGGGISPSSLNPANLANGFLGHYILGNFTESCNRNCYQLFVNRSIDFYGSCSDAVLVAPLDTTYQAAVALSNFQQFRNQSCVRNEENQNCWSLATSYLPLGNTSSDAPNLLSMTCTYNGRDTQQVLSDLCKAAQSWGCCYGTQVAMFQQNQYNATNPADIVPPCVQRYLAMNCPGVDPRKLCSIGARDMVSTISGTVTLQQTVLKRNALPNMYNSFSVLTLGGYIMFALVNTLNKYKHPTYGLNYLRPLQVEIINYNYANRTGQTSSSDGLPLPDPTSDYYYADRGTFDFVFVFANMDNESAYIVKNMINENNFSYSLVAAAGVPATAVSESYPTTYEAQPYTTYPENTGSSSQYSGIPAYVFVLGGAAAVLLLTALVTWSTKWDFFS